jgi:hypothetical protein
VNMTISLAFLAPDLVTFDQNTGCRILVRRGRLQRIPRQICRGTFPQNAKIRDGILTSNHLHEVEFYFRRRKARQTKATSMRGVS